MNFGRAFTYVTEDPEWLKKVIIAALIILIPLVGGLAVMGWGLEINRRIITGETEILPAWDNFGGFIMNGLKELVVAIVYLLPAILIYGCAAAAIVGVTTFTSSGDSGNSDTMGSAIAILTMCMYCFCILFLIIGALLIAPATSVLAETGEIGAALRFGHIFALLRAAIGPYVLSILVVGLAASVGASIGSIACGVGALFVAAYIRAVSSHLYAQAYKIAKATVSA
jgi:hypothetical protein